MANPIPDGFTPITPYLVIDDAPAEIEFLKTLGGVQGDRLDAPGGKVGHAVIKVGGAPIMISSTMPGHDAQKGMIFVYVSDVDATYTNATAFAGVEAMMPPTDQFWGDRAGSLKSPNGVIYWIATHTEDVSMDEIKKRMGTCQ
ncbi:MAG: hypothetical protein QM754_18855 [Tepidisphaeraceae bacterium]